MKCRLNFSTDTPNLTGNPLKIIHIIERFQEVEHLKMLNAKITAIKIKRWLTVQELEDLRIPQTILKISCYFEYCDCPFLSHLKFFSKDIASPRSVINHTSANPDLPPCNFWFSPKLELLLKGDFRLWRWLKRIWRGSWWQISKELFQNVRRNARRSVWDLKGTTLKVTILPLS